MFIWLWQLITVFMGHDVMPILLIEGCKELEADALCSEVHGGGG